MIIHGPPQPTALSETAIPLVLGVAGHRDLREEALPAITANVRKVFCQLREEYPHTPLTLISPLADGADRLVAKIAREEQVALIVPLSWPAGVHDAEIHRTGDRAGFNTLLRQADQVIHLPRVDGASDYEIRSSEEIRKQHYAQVGGYVARHSQILIALWDGDDKPDSGTARVIAWQRQSEAAPFAPDVGRLDEPENGPVYQISTPRSGPAAGADHVKSIVHYPAGYPSDEAAADAFDSMWGHIDELNADIAQQHEAFQQRVEQSKDWLIPKEKRGELPPSLTELLVRFAQADAAALTYQAATLKTLKGVFALVAVAVISFELYTHLLVDWWLLLMLYLSLLLASLGLYKWSARRSHQEKYLDYRAVAEALRVQLFWRLAGLRESVADNYLRNLRTELDWIRQAVRSTNLVTGLHAAADGPGNDERTRTHLDLVRKYWIEDQLEYFDRNGPKNEYLHQRCSRLSRRCFWSAIALGSMLLVVHLRSHYMNHVLVVLVFLAVAAAALVHEYGEKQAFEVQAKRYDWMRSFFATAKRNMDELIAEGKAAEAQEIVLELGEEALHENAEWLLQRRQRPIKPPTV